MKVKVLYFVTDKLVRIMDLKVDPKSGTANYGKTKSFNFDNSKPLHLESGMFTRSLKPFYIVKHDIHKPLELQITKRGKGGDIEMFVTPENFKNMMTQGTLNTLLTLSTGVTSQMVMWMIIGGVVGLLAGLLIPYG